ncbi:PD-(D/E)XK motif protein [Pseudomonas putida CSV86]|uniref:PD-(D/E)XK motif protein n=1 Tax=Pseudomonas bharatica CSV86 TaxID=1005395 RepID=A0A7K4EAC0_9PSED|nr:PD-(D/E)XK motif protein [Pseudomonas bharatica]NNJ14573.1 PD-(D/E)XK motif protein [Pseudomonas bharatica CSV86]
MAVVNSSEIQGIWRALSEATTTPGWRTIDLLKAGTCQLKVARHSPSNEEAVLIGFATTKIPIASRLPKGQGFRMARANLRGALDSHQWLAIIRQPSGSQDLFAAVACDLARLISHSDNIPESQIYQHLLARVRGWQEFMRRGQDGLSGEAEQGLVGELVLILKSIEQGVMPFSIIDAWRGPQKGLHDFLFATGSIEVKSTIATEGFPVSITSLDQLDDSQSSPLYLFGVRLEVTNAGMNLPSFVNTLRAIINTDASTSKKFESSLVDAGYFDIHEDFYVRHFSVSEIKIMLVDSDFPRLTSANVPAEVKWAKYQLDISAATIKTEPLAYILRTLGVY